MGSSKKPNVGPVELSGRARRLADEYLKAEERGDLSESQKALREIAIWEAASAIVKSGWERDYFLKAVLGGSTSVHRSRITLARAGDSVVPLWERINRREMPLRTAMKLLHKAKKLRASSPKLSLRQCVDRCLDEYDSLPHAYTAPDGTVSRRRRPGGGAGVQEVPPAPESNGEGATSAKDLYLKIRRLVVGYITVAFEDIDDETMLDLVTDFEMDLKLSVEQLRGKVGAQRRMRNDQKRLTEQTMRKRLREAFDELAMKRPRQKSGRLPDLAIVKRQYRKLASLYHPDKTPGLDLSAKFNAVTEAYHFICAYYAKQGNTDAT